MEKRSFEPSTVVYKLTGLDNGNILFELDENKSDIAYDLEKFIEKEGLYKFEKEGELEPVLKELKKFLRKAEARVSKEWDIEDVGSNVVQASLKIKFPVLVGFAKPGNSRTRRPTLSEKEIEELEKYAPKEEKYIV